MQNAFCQTELLAEVKYISVMRLKPKDKRFGLQEGSGVHFYDRNNKDVSYMKTIKKTVLMFKVCPWPYP